jgi:hypothetical protein
VNAEQTKTKKSGFQSTKPLTHSNNLVLGFVFEQWVDSVVSFENKNMFEKS